ncbi:MAG: hypothetical protein AAFP86_07370, partial [Planctomycetota bacterium]
MRALLAFSALLLLLAPAPAAAAPQNDVLVLKDGRVFPELDAEQMDGHVAIQLRAGTIEVADSLVDILLEEGKDLTFVPQTDEERERFEKGFVRYEGEWVNRTNARKAIEKMLKQRLTAAKEDLQHKKWKDRYREESKNFNWWYTTSSTVGERYMTAADQYFDIFAKDWRIKRNRSKKKLTIRLYDTAKQYQRVADASPGVLGFFRFVGDYQLHVYYDRNDPDFSIGVLFHEVGHYLHKLLDEDFRMPHWPGESVCEYYAGATLDPAKKKLEVGLILNNRLAAIRRDMDAGRKIELKKMLSTAGGEDYSWGWSFVYMLMKDKKRAKKFKKFFTGLIDDPRCKRTSTGGLGLRTVAGDEVLRYFMECMGIKDDEELLELQEEWYEFIVEEMELTGEGAAFLEAKGLRQRGEREEAMEAYKAAFEENADAARASDHYSYFVLLDRTSDEALEHIRSAVQKAPLSASYRYDLGSTLEFHARLNHDDDEDMMTESTLHKNLALELDPDVEDRVIVF